MTFSIVGLYAKQVGFEANSYTDILMGRLSINNRNYKNSVIKTVRCVEENFT